MFEDLLDITIRAVEVYISYGVCSGDARKMRMVYCSTEWRIFYALWAHLNLICRENLVKWNG